MARQATVVFVDLVGSSALFESLGNAQASEAVTRLTQWISRVVQNHGGRVVKMLGDGVLAAFVHPGPAIDAAQYLQRRHQLRLSRWPASLYTELKIGMEHGEVVEIEQDLYGDAVNIASRLSGICGPGEILATSSLVDLMQTHSQLRLHPLGLVRLRGRNEPLSISHIEWRDESPSNLMTVPQPLEVQGDSASHTLLQLQLRWPAGQCQWPAQELPRHCGRSGDASVCLNGPLVSRMHARFLWRAGVFVVADTSSFGTWVRFEGSKSDVVLRRDECVLHGRGLLALGAPPPDCGSATIHFQVVDPAALEQPTALFPC